MSRFSPKCAFRLATLSACAAGTIFLSGCAGLSGTTVANSSLTASLPKGAVHGGQQPIAGAHVYVFAANTGAGLNPGYKSPSSSLISAGQPGVQSDGLGAYVTTDATGDFNFGGDVTCNNIDPSAQEIYLLATGGNPNGDPNGPSNSALMLSAALGPCDQISASTFVNINEVSTVAMVNALDQFMADGTHVGTPANNVLGLKNAFASINNLIDGPAGTALATTPGGNGIAPQAKINTLANIIATCANSSGPSSPQCTTLFNDSNPVGGSGPATDTLVAALYIATLPGSNVGPLYADSFATAPFQPSLTTQPNDFSIGVTYSGGNLTQPGLLVVDAGGNVWSANCQSCATPGAQDSIVVFSPSGVLKATYTNVGIHNTQGLAFDAIGNLWTVNQASNGRPDEVMKMTAVGNALAGFPVSDASFNGLLGIALDGNGNAWVTANGNSNVIEMNSSGTLINSSPLTTATTGIANPTGVGIDNSGNVWVAATGSSSLLKLTSTGSLISPSGGYTASGLVNPIGIALNSANDVWTVDNQTNQASHVDSTGANTANSPYALALYQAAIIAIDGNSQAFIPSCRMSCVGSGDPNDPDELLRVAGGGNINTGAARGIQNEGFNGIGSAAIDASGNVWVANSVGGTVTEIYGFASPVITPLASAVQQHLVGYRP